MKVTKRNLKISSLALEWCINNLGNPLKTISPTIILKNDKRVKNMYGFYMDQNITIHLSTIQTTRQMVSTIIHEYCHYLQSPRISRFTKYWKLNDKFGYTNNPFEIEARQFELTFTNTCYNYILENL